jgi:ABC-type uncharacterized transport system ATPase subunit
LTGLLPSGGQVSVKNLNPFKYRKQLAQITGVLWDKEVICGMSKIIVGGINFIPFI